MYQTERQRISGILCSGNLDRITIQGLLWCSVLNDSHAGIRKFQNDEFLLFHRPAFTLFYTSGSLPLKSPRAYYVSIQIQVLVVLPQASSPISSKSVKKESLDFSWGKKKRFYNLYQLIMNILPRAEHEQSDVREAMELFHSNPLAKTEAEWIFHA